MTFSIFICMGVKEKHYLRISVEILGAKYHTLVTGIDKYPVNAPSRFMPTSLVFMHGYRRPARRFRQRPQTRSPSPLTTPPVLISWTLLPTFSTRPTNSWPITKGIGMVSVPIDPVIDMEACSIYGGATNRVRHFS